MSVVETSAVQNRRARAWLTRAVEPGQAATYALVQQLGPVEAVQLIRSRQAPPIVLSAVGSRGDEDRVDQDLAMARRFGIRLVTPEDEDEWPAQMLHPMLLATERGLLDLAPPLALWVRGPVSLDEAVRRSVAVIGSRASTAYGEHVAAEIAFGLADRGWTVVSGGALGIDGAAHRARSPPTVSRWRCWPAGSTVLTRRLTGRCSS